MCLAQGNNAVMQVRLEAVALQSQVNHSTTGPLPVLPTKYYQNIFKGIKDIERTSFCLQMDRQAPGSQSISRGPRWAGTHMLRCKSGMGKMLTDAEG